MLIRLFQTRLDLDEALRLQSSQCHPDCPGSENNEPDYRQYTEFLASRRKFWILELKVLSAPKKKARKLLILNCHPKHLRPAQIIPGAWVLSSQGSRQFQGQKQRDRHDRDQAQESREVRAEVCQSCLVNGSVLDLDQALR